METLPHREYGKTRDKVAAEAEELEAVERERARRRMLSGKPVEPSGNISLGSKGETRDKVAAAVGLGSGRTYDKAAKVFGFEHLPLHRGARRPQ